MTVNKTDNFIIKNHHTQNYTTIYNSFVQDKSLSLELRGFGVYLLSMPPNWNIDPKQLRFELNIGRDKVLKLINELIENGYMFKHQKNLTFTKKGETKNTYYLCDDKELLNKTTEPFRRVETSAQLSLSENKISNSPYTETPLTQFRDTEVPCTENPPYNNNINYKENFEKEDNNKKKTLLTNPLSVRTFLKEILDESTIVNLLNAKPDLSIEEFKKLYEMANLEFKGGFCNNLNACLVKAASGKWTFKHNSSSEDTKIHGVLKSKVRYFSDYFKVSACTKDEILGKFLTECTRYSDTLVSPYYDQLKKIIDSN